MYKLIYIILCLLVFSIRSGAENLNTLIDSAKFHYSKENYIRAVELYEQVRDKGFESPELYFNLGNAYYKSGKITYAILNYERAKLLDPHDEDILYNLEVARRLTVDKIDVIPELFIYRWLTSFLDLHSSHSWAVIGIAAWIAFLLLASLFLYSRIIFLRKISFVLGILALAFSVCALTSSYRQKEKIIKRNTAIIFSPTVTAKSSPDKSGTNIFVLHEGIKVNVTDAIGEWVEIRLTDGNVGWLKASDIILI